MSIVKHYTKLYLKHLHNLTFHHPKCNNLFLVIQSSPSKTQIVRQNIREFGLNQCFQEQERRTDNMQTEWIGPARMLLFSDTCLSLKHIIKIKNLKPGDQLSRQENANQWTMFTQEYALYHPIIDAFRAPTVIDCEVFIWATKVAKYWRALDSR